MKMFINYLTQLNVFNLFALIYFITSLIFIDFISPKNYFLRYFKYYFHLNQGKLVY